MNKQTRSVLIYVLVLVAIHSLVVSAIYLEYVGYRNKFLLLVFGETLLRNALITFPVLFVPVAFGIKILSVRQYVVEVLITVAVWEITSVVVDWLVGRLNDPIWMKDMEGRWGAKILGLAIAPLVLISIGASIGQFRKLRRVTVRPGA